MGAELIIFCAVRPEAMSLIRACGGRLIGHQPLTYRSRDGVLKIVITGMGPERAGQVASRVLGESEEKIGGVVVLGLAGGLSPELKKGDLLHPDRVVDADRGDVLQPTSLLDQPQHGTLLTVRAVASDPDRKKRLRAEYAADAVDMETAAIARVCVGAGIDWDVLRVISDPHDVTLVADFARLVRPDGRPDLPGSIRYALTHPHHIPALIELGRTSKQGAALLATAAKGLGAATQR